MRVIALGAAAKKKNRRGRGQIRNEKKRERDHSFPSWKVHVMPTRPQSREEKGRVQTETTHFYIVSLGSL